jgi:hypothetical protein
MFLPNSSENIIFILILDCEAIGTAATPASDDSEDDCGETDEM